MPEYEKMLYFIEIHSVEGIRKYFEEGGDPNEVHDDVPLFSTMIEMYTRTPRFKECVKLFVHAGLKFEDKPLLFVLLDDANKLKEAIQHDPSVLSKLYSLNKNTYTPLTGVTLLHICAEYNAIACGKLLLQHGSDVNARAGIDENGFGGHTSIFHTVNQNNNNSAGMMIVLLENSADLTVTVKGLIWGKGYEWETLIPSVNPISYAMMGLLPQMHRDEFTISETVSLLMKKVYGIEYKAVNVPCAYLRK
jgi:ankyrin repeat protein